MCLRRVESSLPRYLWRQRKIFFDKNVWSYGYGIAKDVTNGKDVFVHHENCLEACKFNSDGTPRVATGFEWLDGVGEKHSGPIGEGTIWFERRDKIYYTTDPEYPNVAFQVSIYPHTNTIVDIDEELDAQQQRRINYVTDDVNGFKMLIIIIIFTL